MPTIMQLIATYRKITIFIGVVVCVCLALAIILAVELPKLHHHHDDHIPNLSLTSLTPSTDASTSWAFSALFSNPTLVNYSLSFRPAFTYRNTTTRSLTDAIIGNGILFHPQGHQTSFSGVLPFDRVTPDISPFFREQQSSGTIRAVVFVGTFLDKQPIGWVCETLLKTTGSPSRPVKCSVKKLD